MNKKRSLLEKLGAFVTGKGFYLVVLVCVAAIGLSGFFLIRSLRGSLTPTVEDLPAAASAAISQAPAVTPAPKPRVTSRPAVPSATLRR